MLAPLEGMCTVPSASTLPSVPPKGGGLGGPLLWTRPGWSCTFGWYCGLGGPVPLDPALALPSLLGVGPTGVPASPPPPVPIGLLRHLGWSGGTVTGLTGLWSGGTGERTETLTYATTSPCPDDGPRRAFMV